jgi:hypothetical protein
LAAEVKINPVNKYGVLSLCGSLAVLHLITEALLAKLNAHSIPDSNKLYICIEIALLVVDLPVVSDEPWLVVGPCKLNNPK